MDHSTKRKLQKLERKTETPFLLKITVLEIQLLKGKQEHTVLGSKQVVR